MDVSEPLGNDLLDVPNGDPATYCRLCLSDIDVEELFPDGQGPRQEVIERIHECTGILITLDEDYPSSVCWMCSLSLEEFQCFRERCHRYDVLIRRKRKELSMSGTTVEVNHGYEVVIEDDDDYSDQDDPEGPLLRISSVQEHFDTIDDDLSNESLLEPSTYQPQERELKPDKETLDAYAEHFKSTGNASFERDPNPDDADRPFKCTLCPRSFKNRANLWEHNRLHTGSLPFSCNDCGTTFSRVKSLMAHKEKYHSKNSTEDPPLRLKCNFCPRVFPRKGDRTQHMKMGHPDQYDPNDKSGDTPTPSFSQERSTPSASATPESVKVKKTNPSPVTSSIVSRFCCNMCLSSFDTAQLLEEHVGLMHPKDGILTCPYCPKTFKSRPTLRMHILNHQGKLPYKCDDCGSRFDRRFYLVKHREKYHIGENRKVIQCRFKCKFCPRLFQRKIDRKTHTRMVHSKEIKIKKEKVDQIMNDVPSPSKEDDEDEEQDEEQEQDVVVVKTEEGSVQKIKKASADSNNECIRCGKHFPSAAMLREHIDDQHLKKKKDVKPPPSPVVKKIKSAKTTLSARRPYKCPYCPKTFTQNYVMKEHTFIHTGSLRYRCDECLAMFNRPHYLQAHKAKYHSVNSKFQAIKCRFCSRSFVRKQDIKIHERIAHGVSDDGSVEREILDDTFNGSADNTIESESGKGGGDGGEGDRKGGRFREKRKAVRKNLDDDDIEEVDDENDEDYVLDDDEDGEEEDYDRESVVDEEEDDDDGIADNGGEEHIKLNSADDPEIRDVVVTLERIPDDVLQSLDNSNEDDGAESNAEDNGNDDDDDDDDGDGSASERSVKKPRLNVGITLHRCPKCFKVFKTRKSLKHHMIYHQSQLPFSCDECGVQFARNRPLQVHKQRYHSEDAPYIGQRFSCDYCPRIFLRDRDKIFHQRTVHITERNVLRDESTPELKKAKIKRRMDYVCLVCFQRFLTEKSCNRHINELHPMEAHPKSSTPVPTELVTPKTEPGTETNQDTTQTIPPHPTSTLQPPSLANAGVKPYKLCRCTTCVAIFKDRENWTAHIQTHPNVRPHHCEPCLLKRKSRTNRKVTSVGFKCQYCPKVFNKASSLRVHQRLHTSELRFPCDECGMMYDRYRLLQAHKERYHSEDAMQAPLETFRCVYCPRTFMRQRDCNYHQESVHAM